MGRRAHGDRHTRRAVCRRKRRYPTRQAADTAAEELYRDQAAVVESYRCGGHWHTGHNRRKDQGRRRDG
jgi:hypothetical protein